MPNWFIYAKQRTHFIKELIKLGASRYDINVLVLNKSATDHMNKIVRDNLKLKLFLTKFIVADKNFISWYRCNRFNSVGEDVRNNCLGVVGGTKTN